MAYGPMPAWDRVAGKPISYFQSKGFEFEVDDNIGNHDEKPTVEISFIVPTQFTSEKVTYDFYSVFIFEQRVVC